MAQRKGKVDVHHHLVPESFRKAMQAVHGEGDGSGLKLNSWSLESTSNVMDELGSTTTIFSLTMPGACIFDGQESRDLARRVNEYCAELRNGDPGRYGFFGNLPSLLDTAGALEEIAYALDHLGADGIIVFTRYGEEDCYLGDERLRPIWKELNRRKAVVLIHPTTPPKRHYPFKHPVGLADLCHETTRTVIDLLLSNTKKDHPDCKMILSHAGGTMPYLSDRIALAGQLPFVTEKGEREILAELKSFYFDLALSGSSHTLHAILEFAGPDRVLFGSDLPYAPRLGALAMAKVWDDLDVTDEVRDQVNFGNAERLFPRLASL